jgi:hypothetical protein
MKVDALKDKIFANEKDCFKPSSLNHMSVAIRKSARK